jgi:hypothetical protein
MTRREDAIRHLADAVELNDRVGGVPWSVRSRYHLARVIKDDDAGRAKALIAEALTRAERHGLIAMRAQLQNAL